MMSLCQVDGAQSVPEVADLYKRKARLWMFITS